MLNLNHKNLNVWKKSIELIKSLYSLTDSFPKGEFYGISNQIRRASVSIASNIAEGASRKTVLERKRFFQIARSSLVEIDTQLEISLVLKFTDKKGLTEIEEKINHLFAMLTNLINNSK